MTLEIDGVDVIAVAQVAGVVGSIVAALIVGLLIFWLVRPPRHVREAKRRPIELDENEAEQLVGLIDRMESRLEVLERALADGRAAAEPVDTKLLETAAEGRETRREI